MATSCKYYGSDDVDLGLMGSAPATIASSEPVVKDVDLSVVWIHDVIGEAESLIVKDPTITDISGLKGKKVAVPFSSTAHYSLLQALADAGLDAAGDVEVINLEPEKMPGSLAGRPDRRRVGLGPGPEPAARGRRRADPLQRRHRRGRAARRSTSAPPARSSPRATPSS